MDYCNFDEGVTKEEFEVIVDRVCRGIKRLARYSVRDASIAGSVLAQSGISEWWFSIDFNDNGHVTGKYRIISENSDSTIPQAIAKRVQYEIESFPDCVDESFWEEVAQKKDPSFNNCSDPKERSAKLNAFVEERIRLAEVMKEKRVRQYEIDEAEKTERLKIETEEREKIRKSNGKTAFICLSVMIAIMLFCFLSSEFDLSSGSRKVHVSLSSKDFVGMNYQEVKSILQKDGFTNISFVKEEDVVLGLISKDGEVKSVTINGNKKFSAGDKFSEDAKIVITYHTRK